MAYAARILDLNHEMKNLSKIGMMRQIATGIFQAENLIFPELCKIKTTVDRIELLARWSGTENPPPIIRKQALLGCGSMLYNLKQSFAEMGWSVEVRLFPKLDREDVIAYVRAGFRNLITHDHEHSNSSDQDEHYKGTLSAISGYDAHDKTVHLQKSSYDGGPEEGETWHFRTKDNDAIAWIRTGQMYARIHPEIQHTGRISIQIPDNNNAGTSGNAPLQNGVALTDQLIVSVIA